MKKKEIKDIQNKATISINKIEKNDNKQPNIMNNNKKELRDRT